MLLFEFQEGIGISIRKYALHNRGLISSYRVRHPGPELSQETKDEFHDLLTKFKELTNCPVLINTSFNVRGEPIVNTPLDAFKCFMGSELDVLVIENFYLEKSKQNRSLNKNYKDKFELD